MMSLIWLGVLVLSIVVEATTMGLVSIWFIPGALISLVLSFFDVGPAGQIVVFVVLAVVLLLFGRRLFRPFNKKEKTNVEALIGQIAVCSILSR